jgi:hypothetical protein
MKYSILFIMLISQISFSDVNFREIDLFKVLSYQTHQPYIETDEGIVSPRILVVGMGRDRCFYVVKRTRSGESSQRNCKFLLQSFPEKIRDVNIPESNVVDFEKSDLNPESETNIIKHINIKKNGDIVFLYERGSGTKTSLYFCTQKLNPQNKGLAVNLTPECEYLKKINYEDDINAHFKTVFIDRIEDFYPVR